MELEGSICMPGERQTAVTKTQPRETMAIMEPSHSTEQTDLDRSSGAGNSITEMPKLKRTRRELMVGLKRAQAKEPLRTSSRGRFECSARLQAHTSRRRLTIWPRGSLWSCLGDLVSKTKETDILCCRYGNRGLTFGMGLSPVYFYSTVTNADSRQ